MKDLFKQYKNLMPTAQEVLKNSYIHQMANSAELLRESSLIQNSVLDAIRGRNSAFEALRESVLQQNSVLDAIRGRNSAFEVLRESVLQQSSFLDAIRGRNSAFEVLRESVLQQNSRRRLLESSGIYDTSLKRVFPDLKPINLLVDKSNFAIRLLEPSRVYINFLENTNQRILKAENPKIARALQTSLHLAEVQFLTTTEALSSIITAPIDDEVSDTRPLNLPFFQQDELIAAVESEDIEDEVALIELSPAANVSALSGHILFLVTQCNEFVKIGQKPEIFKPTNKLLEVFADLPWLLPQTKQSFADFLDCFYFLFYEGAGKDKLRFLKEHGGILERTDCDLIWCIKHLRNKWLRHDADHGQEADIRKSWKELSEKFSWLGLQHAPISQEHFRYLHCRLLEEADAFLQKILEKLIKSE